MKKIAVIDCGTNTFHLLIASVDSQTTTVLHHERQVVKIGQGGINNKVITKDACDRALSTLKSFREKIDELKVDHIKASATSAFRNAKNGSDLRDLIEKETNINIRIISGDEEAELIYGGVTSGIDIADETVLVMDIGGGSVEFIIGDQNGILWKRSYEIGAQRLLDLFHHAEPISESNLNDLMSYLNEQLKELLNALSTHKPKTLIGSSGTFDTISAIYCKRNELAIKEVEGQLPFQMEAFKPIYNELITKNREQRLAIPGMIEMRVDMIVVATGLIDFILKSYDFSDIKIATRALKEGVLAKAVKKGFE